MTPSGTPRDLESRTPDEARAAVTRLKDELAAAKVDTENRRTVVEAITATIGDRILDARAAGDNAAEVVAQGELMAARNEAEVAQKIVDALTRRIIEADKAVLVADANALREEAEHLMEEARPRLAKARQLLDELYEAEAVHAIPEPWPHPSGAVASGSWRRSRTGEMLVEIIEREQRATALEIRSGVSPRPSILTGIADVAWHVGWEGVLESVATIKVTGGQLDDATAALAGREVPPPFSPTREQIMRAGMKG